MDILRVFSYKQKEKEMKGHPATNYAARFQATANRGSYKNRAIMQPRGGKSDK